MKPSKTQGLGAPELPGFFRLYLGTPMKFLFGFGMDFWLGLYWGPLFCETTVCQGNTRHQKVLDAVSVTILASAVAQIRPRSSTLWSHVCLVARGNGESCLGKNSQRCLARDSKKVLP